MKNKTKWQLLLIFWFILELPFFIPSFIIGFICHGIIGGFYWGYNIPNGIDEKIEDSEEEL